MVINIILKCFISFPQVCLTSELIYKYQILTKNMEEVLTRDKEKLQNFEQVSCYIKIV